jgi:hypothetical protein
MKDQFETKIKELVEDFSYDYDPKAWDALSKKLPQTNTGFSWLGKIAIAGILSIGLFTIWFNFNPKSEGTNNTDRVEKNKSQTLNKTNQLSAQKTPKRSIQTKSEANQNISTSAPDNSTNQGWTQITQEVVVDPDYLAPLALGQQPTFMPIANQSLNQVEDQKPQVQKQLLSLDLPGNQDQRTAATPCKGPKIILDADAINYENGTPRIRINAESSGSEITWSANGTLLNQKNRSVDLLAFRGQTYTITAQAHLDECTTTEKIKVTANEDYNLLAVNAFNPESRDERNATFMPYALTIREVRFELLIIDPDNGGLVFKSTDAQNPWNGIDQRNGQLVGVQKAFIWKVVLQEALPNEKTTYSGTIVRI